MTNPDTFPTPGEVEKALEIARNLIKAGVPIFAAPPIEGAPGQYRLPSHWQKTIAAESHLDPEAPHGWKPGWALAAVGGHGVDFLDVDPRNGGDESLAEIIAAGQMPTVIGRQSTPSGGDHYITHPTGDRKSNSFMPGLDMQAGDEAGEGRGFVWIAPTVRPSKNPADAGALRAYRWESEPEYEQIGEFSPGSDPSLDGLRARIEVHRNRRGLPRALPGNPDPGDPFLTPGMIGGLAGLFAHQGYAGPREFTQAQMLAFLAPVLDELKEAQIGNIEESCNAAAAALYHFVPEFWTVDQAMAILEARLAETAYDPNGPSDWTVEKFRAVLDGRRPPLDAWKALRRTEAVAPEASVETAPGEEMLSTVEKLRARMRTASQIAARKPPRSLVHGLLRFNTEAWMIGAPGSLKSFVALDLAGHVGRGQDWQGHRVVKTDVLYIAAEGEDGMTLRTRAWEKVNGEMVGVTFLPYPVQVKSSDGQWDALVQIVAEDKPGFIIIDTQHRVSAGLEENSATDMGILISAIGRLKRAAGGACVMPVHHTGRSGGNARGSSALDGAQDTELHIKRGEPRELLTCSVVQDKQKDMAEAGGKAGLQVQFSVVDLGQDEETGEYLSSLVMRGDHDAVHAEMMARSGFKESDVEPWKGQQAGEWTKDFPEIPANSTLKRRILQVLADHAHDRGLTQAEARRAVVARWYEKGRAPDAASWSDGWNVVTSLDVTINVAGERWLLDQVKLREVMERYPPQ